MCIIAIKPKGKKMFDDEIIRTMFFNNPDGAGYMYFDKTIGKVIGKKGFMTYESLIKSLHSQDFTEYNLIVHFRIGTSGLNDSLNCHPYPIFERNRVEFKTDIAMAHNGILSSYTPSKRSKINDTQMFINLVLNGLSKDFLKSTDCLKLLEIIAVNNRLAFLDSNDKVTLIGDFIEDSGYIYSNTTYKNRKVCTRPHKVRVDYNSIWDEKEEDDGFWAWYDGKYGAF